MYNSFDYRGLAVNTYPLRNGGKQVLPPTPNTVWLGTTDSTKGSGIKEDEKKLAAIAWLTEAKKLEKNWPKTVPTVPEMMKMDRRHNE